MIHPISLLDFCNFLNAENPHPVFGVSTWPLEPNTLGVFKRTGPYTSEWEDLIQSDNPKALYRAIRTTLRRRIHQAVQQ